MTLKIRIGGYPIKRFITAFSKYPLQAETAYKEFIVFAETLEINRGLANTIKVLKDINSRARHYASGYPRGGRSFSGVWLKINKKTSFPRKLNSLKRIIDLEPNIGLLIPNLVYTLTVKPSFDISTIESPYKGTMSEEEFSLFDNYCKRGCPKLRMSHVSHLFTCKGGPNGPSAISHAQDLVALEMMTFPKPYEELIKLFHGRGSWLQITYRLFKSELFGDERNVKTLVYRQKQSMPLNAKLEFISAPAGKTRIVYVANWWVQAILLPMNESLMDQFRIMRDSDATWDQNSGVDRIREWSEKGYKLFSYDLSAATDRWPIKHQKIVIRNCFSSEVADAWEFFLKEFPPYDFTRERFVNYAVGQPMGVFTSWAALNMAHHMVIRYLAWRLRRPLRYMVLGDDIVIADENLAIAYKGYMNRLGVVINDSKSLICEEGKPSSAEFARNLVRDGKIVGCISPNILGELLHNHNIAIALEFIRTVGNLYGAHIYVYDAKALLPRSIYQILGKKCLRQIKYVLCHSSTAFHCSPVVHLKEDESPPDGDYVELVNPWSEIGTDCTIDGLLFQHWTLQQLERVKSLQELKEKMSNGESRPLSGYCLELENHPLNIVLSGIEYEIQNSIMEAEGYKGLSPMQLTTSLTLLEDVLLRGIKYKDWRDSQTKKHKNLLKFFRGLHKESQNFRVDVKQAVRNQLSLMIPKGTKIYVR